MKIVAFAGSNSINSINKKLIQHVCTYFKEHEVELLDLNDYECPLFGVDLEMKIGIPDAAKQFANKIDSAGLLILSLAEHNGAYTAAFKNLFDWISRIKNRKAFGEKDMFLMACSDGKRGASSVLEIAKKRMPFSGGNVLESFSLPSYYSNFVEGEGIIDNELKHTLESKIKTIQLKLSSK
ncbi:MAG: NAD(P)H-dependent oxidoreductase [Bacteroidia bacterium]